MFCVVLPRRKDISVVTTENTATTSWYLIQLNFKVTRCLCSPILNPQLVAWARYVVLYVSTVFGQLRTHWSAVSANFCNKLRWFHDLYDNLKLITEKFYLIIMYPFSQLPKLIRVIDMLITASGYSNLECQTQLFG